MLIRLLTFCSIALIFGCTTVPKEDWDGGAPKQFNQLSASDKKTEFDRFAVVRYDHNYYETDKGLFLTRKNYRSTSPVLYTFSSFSPIVNQIHPDFNRDIQHASLIYWGSFAGFILANPIAWAFQRNEIVGAKQAGYISKAISLLSFVVLLNHPYFTDKAIEKYNQNLRIHIFGKPNKTTGNLDTAAGMQMNF